MNDAVDMNFLANLKWSAAHPPFFQTHHILLCPACKTKCHSLYVLGEYPNDSLACKKCIKSAILLSEKEKEVLLHSLGISEPEQRESYRNFYCTFVGDPLLMKMVERGLMMESTIINGGRDQYFTVSDYGKEVAASVQPKPLSRSKKRYHDYLKLSDVWYDLTFKEYLKQRLYIGRIE